MADANATLTVKLDAPTEQRWGSAFPVEVRDSAKLVLTASSIGGGTLEIPAGRYFVSALLPNGQQATADDIVVLQPGDDKQVQLSVSDLNFPNTLRSTKTFGDTVRTLVQPLTQYFSTYNVAIVRGNWLRRKLLQANVVVSREPTVRSGVEIGFSEVPVWIEIASSARATYLAVPVDERRSTTIQWELNPQTERLELRLDFNDGELNSFFDFVQNGKVLEARSISQSLIAQSEQYMKEKKRSPLCAVLGAYVLLRANELDGMDIWTSNLMKYCNWLPDALAVRVEYLSRNGRHTEALKLLLDVPEWGTPWFRSGVGYLEKRARVCAAIAASKRSNLSASDEDVEKMGSIAAVFGELAAALDMTQMTTVLRDIARIA
jgi:hypothetical protein